MCSPDLAGFGRSRHLCSLFADQAVKTLSETWHPDDIPAVFTVCRQEALCAQPEASPLRPSSNMASHGFASLFTTRNTQLPSPMSPTSRPTPSPPGDGCESYPQTPEGSGGSNLIPIKGFVHEVLRRSRTSTGVLQTALCYLEAVRAKVPDLLRTEKVRPTSDATQDQSSEPRIIQGLFEEVPPYTDGVFSDAPDKTAGPTLETIRIGDTVLISDVDDEPRPVCLPPQKEESALPPLPALPSPLCCPRRTFLACLILASKFIQDRSYSNRAWAKLAGLPPREIGRCERALGEALEWRLWVGKLPTFSTTVEQSHMGRILMRSRSDGDVLSPVDSCTRQSTAPWAASGTAGAAALAAYPRSTLPAPLPPPSLRTRGLQRSATIPMLGPERSNARVGPFFLPASQCDGLGAYYDTRPTPGTGFDMAFAMDVEPQTEVSPSLSTPTLTYSPMSSASSSSDGSEDRTIQMSMFVDLPTPALSACGTSGGPWVASSMSYTPANPSNPYASYTHINGFNAHLQATCPMYVDDSEGGSGGFAGPTLPAIHIGAAKTKMSTLPSFSEAFPESNLGTFGVFSQ